MKHANQTVKFFKGVSLSIRTAASLILAIFVLASCASNPQVIAQKPYVPEIQEKHSETSADKAEYEAVVGAFSVIGAFSGTAKLADGDYDGAITDFKACLELAPAADKPQYREMLGTAYGVRGIFLAQKGYYDNAISDLEAGIRLVPAANKKPYREAMGAVYGIRGASKGMEGYYDGAISDLEKCLALLPDGEAKSRFKEMLAVIYAGRGMRNEMNGNDIDALGDYLNSLKHAVAR